MEAGGRRGLVLVAAAYLVLTLVMTWPLAAGLATEVPSDLGDSLYFMWAIDWSASQIVGILSGDLGRLATFFDANAFYPERLALAYSDHIIPQALQALPLLAFTDNLILVYNLLFLSTFVLSAFGTFLFVRELTGSPRAAFVAGLLFAFAGHRIAHLAHLNLLSAQWAPFVLYGLRRYFVTGRRMVLAGAAVALTVQNLSSGYYLLFFVPVTTVYVLWEMAANGYWRSRRMWTDLAVAGAVVAAATAPFLLPYLALRDRLPSLREVDEVRRYSADVYAYLTASPDLRAWGDVFRAYPRPEGYSFPALMPLLCAAVGVVLWAGRAIRTSASGIGPVLPKGRRWLVRACLAVAGGYAALAVATIFLRRVIVEWGPIAVQARDVTRLAAFAVVAFAAAALAAPRVRAAVRALVREPEVWAVGIVGLAWWLSLGPTPMALGRAIELPGVYDVLRTYVPGYDGLRVPARWGIVVAFGLAVLGGLALRNLDRRRWGGAACAALVVVCLADARFAPMPMNRVPVVNSVLPPARRVYPAARRPTVYGEVGETPADAVLVELPLGRPEYDSRAMYYSTMHGRHLVNGYSGYYPPRYQRLIFLLSDVPGRPDLALEGFEDVGATHVLVHEAAYVGGTGDRVSTVLAGWGATELFREGSDVLYALPSR